MVSLTSAGLIRRDGGVASFYTFLYTAGWDWLVRSSTDWHVECAKPHLRGTGRHRTGRDSSLITRRSQFKSCPRHHRKCSVRKASESFGGLASFWPATGCLPTATAYAARPASLLLVKLAEIS